MRPRSSFARPPWRPVRPNADSWLPRLELSHTCCTGQHLLVKIQQSLLKRDRRQPGLVVQIQWQASRELGIAWTLHREIATRNMYPRILRAKLSRRVDSYKVCCRLRRSTRLSGPWRCRKPHYLPQLVPSCGRPSRHRRSAQGERPERSAFGCMDGACRIAPFTATRCASSSRSRSSKDRGSQGSLNLRGRMLPVD